MTVNDWSGFLVWSLSGLLYAAAGVVAIVNPFAGQQGWGWLDFSGLITLATGILVAIGWPANSLWILGLLLGFDLLFQGWSLLFAGLALRKSR